MYFTSNFPTIEYDPTGSGDTTKIQDILTRIKVREGVRERDSLFSKYDVKNGEAPELVAHRLYGDVEYYWVILLMNKIFNRYYDWPMTDRDLQQYVIDTYSDPNGTHHYEKAQSSGDTTIMIRVESDVAGASIVTNYEYEITLNDERSQIKLLRPTYLGSFVGEFNKLLKAA